MCASDCLAAATQRTGVPKGTIRGWAKKAGVSTGDGEKTRAATRVAAARHKRSLEERRGVLVEKLGELAELGLDWAAQLIERGGDEIVLRDAVGAFTRAIHDLQLLSGGATSRHELAEREQVLSLRDELAERRRAKAS